MTDDDVDDDNDDDVDDDKDNDDDDVDDKDAYYGERTSTMMMTTT